MFLAQATVHTSGINWESVITIIASICAIVAVLGGFASKYVAGKITAAIREFQVAVVAKLDTRLTTVEDKLDRLNPLPSRRRP